VDIQTPHCQIDRRIKKAGACRRDKIPLHSDTFVQRTCSADKGSDQVANEPQLIGVHKKIQKDRDRAEHQDPFPHGAPNEKRAALEVSDADGKPVTLSARL